MNRKTIGMNGQDDLRRVHSGKYLGGSEVAAIAGLNRWTTPLELWALKTGKSQPKELSQAMKLGQLLEPIVAKLYIEKRPDLATLPNLGIYQHPDYPWAVATPDFFLYHKADLDDPSAEIEPWGLLECKTTSAYRKDDWQDGLNQALVPDNAHCQLQWQLGVLGLQRGAVACLIGGRDFVYKEIEFNPDVFAQLLELGKKFMGLVESGTPPEAIAEDEQPPPSRTEIVSIDSYGMQVEKYLELQKRKRDTQGMLDKLSDEMKALENNIAIGMNGSENGLCGKYALRRSVIHYKERVTKAYEVVRFSIKEIL